MSSGAAFGIAEKVFICETCGKAFKWRSNLHEHMTVHSAVMKHVCPYCGKLSRLKGNMTKHIIKHHGTSSDQTTAESISEDKHHNTSFIVKKEEEQKSDLHQQKKSPVPSNSEDNKKRKSVSEVEVDIKKAKNQNPQGSGEIQSPREPTPSTQIPIVPVEQNEDVSDQEKMYRIVLAMCLLSGH